MNPPPPPLPTRSHHTQEDFLRGKIKVNGKTGKLGSEVTLKRDKNEIAITSEIPFSKRYVEVTLGGIRGWSRSKSPCKKVVVGLVYGVLLVWVSLSACKTYSVLAIAVCMCNMYGYTPM